MAYLITAHYGPGAAQARLRIRDRHLAYLIEHEHLLLYGGALLDDSVEPPRVEGMFLALELASRDQAQGFLSDEPYHAAGLFAAVRIHKLEQFVPNVEADFLRREWERESRRLTADAGAAAPGADR